MEKREIEGNALKNMVRRGLKAALDLLVPRGCLVCERSLELSEEHLCRECLEDLPQTYYWLRKFNPMADRFNALIQDKFNSQLNISHIDYAFAAALFFYRDESEYRRIPYQIKYHGNLPAGRFFGQMLGQKIASAEHFADVDAVIPVPLHWARHWKRGYNQAEVIASEVSTALGVELRPDILQRCRRTRTQTKLTIEGKTANVQGAFRVRTSISNSNGNRNKKAEASDITRLKHLLIIDDVFTTGNTALACYSALRTILPPSIRISIATLAFVGET